MPVILHVPSNIQSKEKQRVAYVGLCAQLHIHPFKAANLRGKQKDFKVSGMFGIKKLCASTGGNLQANSFTTIPKAGTCLLSVCSRPNHKQRVKFSQRRHVQKSAEVCGGASDCQSDESILGPLYVYPESVACFEWHLPKQRATRMGLRTRQTSIIAKTSITWIEPWMLPLPGCKWHTGFLSPNHPACSQAHITTEKL